MKHIILIFTYLFCQSAFAQGWKVDTTLANSLDLPITQVAHNIGFPTQINDKQFIVQVNSINDGHCLYVSDGTQKGTEMILRLNKTADLGDIFENNYIYSMYRFENKVYVLANNRETRYHKLWETDGSKAGTKEISGLDNVDYGYFETIGSELYYFRYENIFKLINGKFEKIKILNNIPEIDGKGYNITEYKKLFEYGNNVLFKVNIYNGKEGNVLLIKYNFKSKQSSLFSPTFPNTYYFDLISANGFYYIGGMTSDFSFIQKIEGDFSSFKLLTTNPIESQENNEVPNNSNSSFKYSVVGNILYASIIKNNEFSLLKFIDDKPPVELFKYQTTKFYFQYNISRYYIEKVGNHLIFVGPEYKGVWVTNTLAFFKLFSFSLENEKVAELGNEAFKMFKEKQTYSSFISFISFKFINSNELEIEMGSKNRLYFTTNGITTSAIDTLSKLPPTPTPLQTFEFKGKKLSPSLKPNQIVSYDETTKKITTEIDFGFGGKQVNSVLYKDDKHTFLYNVISLLSAASNIGVSKNSKFKYLGYGKLQDFFKFGNTIYYNTSYYYSYYNNFYHSRYNLEKDTAIYDGLMAKYDDFWGSFYNGYGTRQGKNLIPFGSKSIIKGLGYGRLGNELGYIDEKEKFTSLGKIDSTAWLNNVIIDNKKVWFFVGEKKYLYENNIFEETEAKPPIENNDFWGFLNPQTDKNIHKIGEKEFTLNNQTLSVKNGLETTVLLDAKNEDMYEQKKLFNDKYFQGYASFTFKDKFYFTAKSPRLGEELWVSDGTVANTKILKDIEKGSESSYPILMGAFADRLYFSAFTEENGQELYSTDGTEEGTKLEMDFLVGPRSSRPFYFDNRNNKLYVMAYTTEFGYQVWTKDIVLSAEPTLKPIEVEVNIFPNPVLQTVNYTINNSASAIHDISIFNQFGQIVFANQNINNTKNTLNVAELPIGLYYLIVKTDKGSFGKKFLKD